MLRFYTINALFLVIFSLMVFYGFFGEVSLWFYLLFILIWVTITVIGSFQIKMNYHLQSLNHNYDQTENFVSITFDDGPNAEFTPKALDLLKKYQAKATFFLIGSKAETHPNLVKKIIEEGHSIGNHSYSHSNRFGFFSSKKIVSELEKTDAVLQSIIGKRPKLFRPPYGVTNPNIKKALTKTGHYSIGWSKRSLDTTKLSEDKIFNRITSKLQKGDIILLHDGSAKTIAVLERLLLFLESRQLKSVGVEHLLEIDAYA